MEVASQSETFVKLTLRKAKAKTSIEMNCLIAPPRAIHSKSFLLTGRLYWLLGNTADAEIEKELLTSDDLFEELLIQEAEIIDEFVRWQISFLTTPERRWNLEFALL